MIVNLAEHIAPPPPFYSRPLLGSILSQWLEIMDYLREYGKKIASTIYFAPLGCHNILQSGKIISGYKKSIHPIDHLWCSQFFK